MATPEIKGIERRVDLLLLMQDVAAGRVEPLEAAKRVEERLGEPRRHDAVRRRKKFYRN